MSRRSTKKEKSNEFITSISKAQERALRALAEYKFLTVSQFVRLHVGIKNRTYEALKSLEQREYVKFIERGTGLERVYYLTYHGATLLVINTPNEHIDNIKYPKSDTTLFTSDAPHRLSSISTQISFKNWLVQQGFELIQYDSYFDKVGSRKKHNQHPLKSVTRINFGNDHFLDPDGIGVYVNNGKPKITLFETYNGKDTKRVMEQMRKHIYVIKHGLAAEKYNVEAPARACSTFESMSEAQAVIKRLREDPYFQFNGVEHYFFFGVASEIWQDFENSFYNLNGERIKMSDLTPVGTVS